MKYDVSQVLVSLICSKMHTKART